MLKVDILNRLVADAVRYFKVNFRKRETKNIVQFTSGGDDYCPAENVEGLADYIGDNPAHGVIFAYRDNTEKKAQKGEKRLYSVKETENGQTLSAEIWLKNNDKLVINTTSTEITSDIVLTGNTTQTGNVAQTGNTVITGSLTADNLVDTSGATGTIVDSNGKVCASVVNGIIKEIY